MSTVYSTREVHPRDRLSYWLEVVTKTFVRHEFRTRSGAAFSGTLKAGALGTLGVATLDCDTSEVGRSRLDIARDDSNDLIVCLQVAGSAIWEQADRQAVCGKGSFVLMDTRRPFSVVTPASTNAVSLAVPRSALEARLGSTDALTARAMDPLSPLAQLAAAFLTKLPPCVDTADAVAAAQLADQTLDLLALALSEATAHRGMALSSPRSVALLRLKATIESRLDDPELSPAVAAAASGISVRYANALLAEEGTSLERFIVARRLERCRRALADPAQAHRMIGEIAYGWGFSDLSHFGRRFKAEFGLSPSEYRREAAATPATAGLRQ